MEKNLGVTTRLVDYYVQELFENLNTWILVEDNPNNKDNNLKLCDKIKLRLMREHDGFTISQRENQLRLCNL